MKPRIRTLSIVVLILTLALENSPTARAADFEIKLEKSRTKNFGASPTIIVPTVYLKLPIAGKVFVAKQGGVLSGLGGGGGNSVKAKATYAVKGMDKEFAQQLAAKVQENFVAELKEAGYNVKTYDDLKSTDAFADSKLAKVDEDWGLPTEKDPSGNTVFLLVAPTDAQNFKGGLAGGAFAPFMRRGKSTLGEGTIVIPTYVIAAPQAWGETGGGYKRISAKVNVLPGMNLSWASVALLTEKGGWGDVRLKEQIINISEQVGELTDEDTTDRAGNAVSSALSILSGAGRISSKSGFYQMNVDRTAYEAGLLRGVGAFNAEVGKVVAEAKQ
ncbi:MAG TPA: hypothetical protein VEH04_05525 [Verrucomicrobiae bacterium]|nr:hypothetical protein [Verrucomicrobiae bacterium]